ncbi:hypothetical protein VA596_44815 [Amycolatopsis sp., V23-08]|uniref:Uncharacterized protein n=1 Tax=Amycolatopsis heterodermiae TaxID=3110235 RepID=A0ABU5RKA2_9PSEU|nr:hypothetical protein [Amycolatopsis sp., V23-08]MEA5366720.1 hypothetical protein [Amycolatopsis sp., V23-08]
MPVICPTRAMERWTVRIDGAEAVFSCAPLVEDHTAARALPRVWAGRGLGVADVDLPGLIAALGEVMKTPAYWHGRTPGTGAAWSEPRRDPEDGFVYLSGPCGDDTGGAGYRPVYSFAIGVATLRDLRIRLTAYHHGT